MRHEALGDLEQHANGHSRLRRLPIAATELYLDSRRIGGAPPPGSCSLGGRDAALRDIQPTGYRIAIAAKGMRLFARRPSAGED